jgi:hypothetical protein
MLANRDHRTKLVSASVIVAEQLFIIDLLLVLVYAACVCYDFWDLLRAAN